MSDPLRPARPARITCPTSRGTIKLKVKIGLVALRGLRRGQGEQELVGIGPLFAGVQPRRPNHNRLDRR